MWQWSTFDDSSQTHLIICEWMDGDLQKQKTVVAQIISSLDPESRAAGLLGYNFREGDSYILSCLKENQVQLVNIENKENVTMEANKLLQILKEYIKVCR